MYDTSEDAMRANDALGYGRAAAELHRHTVNCRPSAQPGMIEVEAVSYRAGDEQATVEWETIPCTSKALLEWLGY